MVANYYKVLGIKRSASRSEVKSAYRKLARLRHPDVNGGSEKAAQEFALLARAYGVLIDPQERAHHDQQAGLVLRAGAAAGANSPAERGPPAANRVCAARAAGPQRQPCRRR